jgi:serine/threonine protein kinase
MNHMTPSPHISQIQVRRPHWMRSYRPSVGGEPVAPDPSDIDTVSFEGDAGDRPTNSFEPAHSRSKPPPRAVEPAASREPQSEGLAAPRDIGPGSVLRGRYLIEKAIGVGGTSTVFSALDRHRSSARANGHGSEQGSRLNGFGRIAVKVLRSETGASDARVFRMEREFRQMQRLTHSGIVRVFDLDCEDNLWFITMELLEGQPLHRYLRSGLKDTEALRILTQCAEALAYAHDQGIVHGDLKPGNVFITQDGSVRLFDFGSAPDLAEGATEPMEAHRFAATPPYASPETLEGRGVDERDEVFSLGCLAYELLSGGQHPFDRKSSLDARQQGLRPQPVAPIRAQHLATIARALSWDRTERPATAREFLRTLLAPEPHRETNASRSTPLPSAHVSMPADLRVAPEQASQVVDIPPTVEVRATPAEQTDPVKNATTDGVSDKSVGAAEALANAKVSVEWTPSPVEENNATEQVAVAESTREQRTTAESSALPDLDDPPPRKFAGFVPPEMVARPKRTVEAPRRSDLHVSGLSQGSPWLKRTLVIALLGVALLAGYFVLGRQLPTKTAVSVVPPVVAEAEASNVEPQPAPSAPLAEEVAPVEAPPPPVPTVVRSAPGEVSFESETVKVSAAQSMAVVNIARLKSTRGAVPIKWSTVGDTAQPGVHYDSVDSKVTRFNDGQSVRSLFIQLKNDPREASRPARSFIVKLEKAAGGPELGAITQARVIVEGH